jgi:L-ascorbate metabolism protein UlaG (beta-lactamase superfamily)
MNFTYLGHACFAIEINGYKIIVDPFIKGNELAKHIDFNSLQADYIFVSHGHEDHIADCIALALQTNATVIANWEICGWLQNKGVSKTHPMNTGGEWQFEFGKLKCVVAQHSSSLPDGSYGGVAIGVIFYSVEGDYYYTGDTALTMDMQLVKSFGNLQAVILPIGNNFTMGVSDSIACMKMLECPKAVGVHYDTFGYIKINKAEALEQFATNNLQLYLPNIGETIEI